LSSKIASSETIFSISIAPSVSIIPGAILEDKKKYPLECYGKPDDVANACIYLLSDASKWVTGSKLVVDGGFTIQ
jgi:NAD(P)-dependent dehydrogenase (short-subunit alcohol dehydrogenase family)